MTVIKLTKEHIDDVRPLFKLPKFMGVSPDKNYFVGNELKFEEFYHQAFTETYLTDLKSYHAYAYQDDDGAITATIGFYESGEDASWYWNHVRTLGNNSKHIKAILDKVIEYNENNGRFKFYSMFPVKYINVYRRLAFSKTASRRYDYFDEFQVESKNQAMFSLPWQILYNKTLVPVDTVVRCTFLKQKYRKKLFHAGRL
jgi:hypothetical protein